MRKLSPKFKKYIRPTIAVIILILGCVFMLVPFIPLGYILVFAGLFLIAPFFPFVKRWIDKLKKNDNNDSIEKAEKKIQNSEDKINEWIIDEKKNN